MTVFAAARPVFLVRDPMQGGTLPATVDALLGSDLIECRALHTECVITARCANVLRPASASDIARWPFLAAEPEADA